ncbi:Hypothetical predicted protein [Olea europaea subsp. europaea]|uniref:Uncharacterized protein n=1 Tax=Olea europaea subsp. europaea TaxID=158383 RepID=A0A8S0TR66_OLEEU|nr:Hypothetical predicted protein [Olea europaea subsp. europaea]
MNIKQTCRKSTAGSVAHRLKKHQHHIEEVISKRSSDDWATILAHRGKARGLEYLVRFKDTANHKEHLKETSDHHSDKIPVKTHWVGIAILGSRRPDLLSDYRQRLKQAAWTRSNAKKGIRKCDFIIREDESIEKQESELIPVAYPKPLSTSSDKKPPPTESQAKIMRHVAAQAGEPIKEVREMSTQTSLTYFIWDTVL